MAGDEAVTFEDFAEVFPTSELPFSVADSNIHKVADTTTIAHSILYQFVPDSVFKNVFGKDTNYIVRPVAKLDEKEKEDYLAVYVKGKQKSSVVLLVFNQDKFSAAMPLITTAKDKVNNTATIDKKLSIALNSEWNKDNELMYNRQILAYNTAGTFTTVLTETNVPQVFDANTVLNPIDTFPTKNKYSGDYLLGKNNILSIRDAKTPDTYHFFIYFINQGEDACSGNLKGELSMTSATTGQYSSSTDPCVVDFTFSTSKVQVKETGSCGNYRGITCFFDHTFTKKKPAKATTTKKQ